MASADITANLVAMGLPEEGLRSPGIGLQIGVEHGRIERLLRAAIRGQSVLRFHTNTGTHPIRRSDPHVSARTLVRRCRIEPPLLNGMPLVTMYSPFGSSPVAMPGVLSFR